MAVSSIGVGSGIDLESLVVGLLNAEKTPLYNALDSRQKSIKAEISAYGALNSALDKFKTSLEALDSESKVISRSATSSDTSYFTATATSSASNGNYSIEVINLAQAQKIASTATFSEETDPVGEGSLTLSNNKGDSFTVNVALNNGGEQKTLAELRDLINNDENNFGVRASILAVDADGDPSTAGTIKRLVLSSETTGLDNQLSITVNDSEGGNNDAFGLSRFYFNSSDPTSQVEEIQSAENAELSVDGLTVFSNSNTFDSVITGLSITAKRELSDVASPEGATLTIANNTTKLTESVKGLVDAYNAVRAVIKNNTDTTEQSGNRGAFNGDFTVRSLDSRLKEILGSSFEDNSTLRSLADIGVTTQRDGTLKLDEKKLTDVFESNPEELSGIFAGVDGLNARFESRIEAFVQTGGILDTRTKGFNSQLSRIDDRRESLDYRFQLRERVLRDQFIALDTLVASLQSTGAYLAGQLASAAAINGA